MITRLKRTLLLGIVAMLLLSATALAVGQSRSFGLERQPPIYQPPPPPPSRYLVVTSDPQYPWAPPHGVNDENGRSRALIESQYDSINRFASRNQVLGTFVNGDLTAFGHPWQVDYMKQALKRLKTPVFLGLGNHDYENNINDCYENQCARRSVYWLMEHMKGQGLDSFDAHVNNYYKFPSNFEEVSGSLGWAKTFGDVTVIQLNNHSDYQTQASGWAFSRGLRELITIKPSLAWLEQRLAIAKRERKAVVLMTHVATISPGLARLLNQYPVTAIFAGHWHGHAGQVRGLTHVPLFISGSADHRTYLVAELPANGQRMLVHLVRNNDVERKEKIADIPLLKGPTLSPLW
jgi:predicted MPP superfamily phosphohydrolase